MNKLKESILNDATKGGGENTSNASNDATNATSSAITSNTSSITRSSYAYIYNNGAVNVLVIDPCVCFSFNHR